MRSLTPFPILLLTLTVNSQTVDPYPMSNCGSNIAGLELQCPGSTGCCAGGASCCAGGCCPLTANCINFGTANEACCPFSDTTNCRFGVTKFPAPACTAVSGFKPDKLCVGASGSWYCPPEDVCDLANGGCFPFPKASCTYDDNSPQSTAPTDALPVESQQGTTPVESAPAESSPPDTTPVDTLSTNPSPVVSSPVVSSPVDASTPTSPPATSPNFTSAADMSTVDSPQSTFPVRPSTADTSPVGSPEPTQPVESPTFSDSTGSPTTSGLSGGVGATETPPPNAANSMSRSNLLASVLGASVFVVLCL